MNKRQEQQIVDYYSTTDRYIRSDRYSDSNQTVFTKENDRYQWLVLEQKSQHDVEIRQTDSHGTITARDNYELTRNIPKCVGVERLCKDANMQIPFTADEINLIYQFWEQSKAETCAHLSAILPQIKDNDTKQIVCSTLKKLNVLSEETCAELAATIKRRKLTERDHSIKVRLSKAEKQLKEPTITEEKQNRIGRKGKAGMRKLDTLVADFPATYKLMKQDEVSKTYSFPKSFVSYRKPRAVNTEQRERARQMMIKQNNSK